MTSKFRSAIVAVVASAAVLAGCERPPMDTKQQGYRGVGMEQVTNPRLAAREAPLHVVPAPQPSVPSEGPKAGEIYKNVKLLGHLSVGEFTRLMVAMTEWVSPVQGCNYCHNPNDLADDSVYTKVVTRSMLQMTWQLNSNWKNHVADTGVTCYTCHRGNAVPNNVWSTQAQETRPNGLLGQRNGQNMPAASVAYADLPFDPFTPFLLKDAPIRVLGKAALPNDASNASIQATEWTYGLMMHMSDALGQNCTFCHNTRSFASWEGPPARVTAYHGIRMVRDANSAYIEPLSAVFPANRKGPLGDVLKVNCATCHQGVNKPLNGVSMLKDYPELRGPGRAGPAAAAAPTPTAAATPAAPVTGTIGKILFEVDKTDLNPEARGAIAAVAGAMRGDPGLKIDVSGFADQSGSAAHNLDLARQRAMAVRDALIGAGAPADRINLRKPEFVIGGASADARRVDLIASR